MKQTGCSSTPNSRSPENLATPSHKHREMPLGSFCVYDEGDRFPFPRQIIRVDKPMSSMLIIGSLKQSLVRRGVAVVTLLAALLLPWASETLSAAELRLGSPFCDHMVLQRDKPVAVWGWADAGESVTVAFDGQSKTTTADTEGKWSLKLDTLKASAEGRVLKTAGKDGRCVEVKDVLVGEVWFGSGQSNMAMAVASAAGFEAEKAAANSPQIRYYGESSGAAELPQDEGKGSWHVCTPATVGRFSAALYFFGREIHRELGVPVGLVCAAVGATHIESWVSGETQSSDSETKAGYDAQLRGWRNFDEGKIRSDYPQKLAAWKLAVESGKAGARDMPWTPETTIAHIRRKGPPAGLYNGKVFNLAPYTLRGILWYQGESNAGHPDLYQKQLSQLVTSWRLLWKDELPFAWVQLPSFTSPGEGWPRMREAMLKTLELPKTGMAVTIDIGDRNDIHPTNKQEVGRRLSLWALGAVYSRPVPAVSGPLPGGASVNGNTIAVSFQHADSGLRSEDRSPIRGFEIAGADRSWKPATAKIDGTRVLVSSPEVSSPVAVRYAWRDFPDCNLSNGAGLPASPFRTDDWK
jgi:sialate O-acetylesterase